MCEEFTERTITTTAAASGILTVVAALPPTNFSLSVLLSPRLNRAIW
jgi:hypothetical protein